MIEVKTGRLTLFALTPDLLEALVRGWPHLDAALGVNASDIRIPEELREAMPAAFALCLDNCRRRPDAYLWYTVWPIVLNEENRLIGTIGFAGPPDEQGEVCTGYWIDERYRNRGYMTEAVRALAKWALENAEITAVTANTPEDNLPSQRVLAKSGFRRRGESEGQPSYVLTRP